MSENHPHSRNVLTTLGIVLACMLTFGWAFPGCVLGPDSGADVVHPGQFRIVVLYESSADNSRSAMNSMYSTAVREAIRDAAGDDGCRMLDKDVEFVATAGEWKDLADQAKAVVSTRNMALPVIVFFGRGKPQAFAFPDSADATVALIKKVKG